DSRRARVGRNGSRGREPVPTSRRVRSPDPPGPGCPAPDTTANAARTGRDTARSGGVLSPGKLGRAHLPVRGGPSPPQLHAPPRNVSRKESSASRGQVSVDGQLPRERRQIERCIRNVTTGN